MDPTTQVAAIARLEAYIESMSRSIARLEKLTEEQHQQLTTIEKKLSEANGGLRAVLWVGGPLASGVGAAAMWIAKYFPN